MESVELRQPLASRAPTPTPCGGNCLWHGAEKTVAVFKVFLFSVYITSRNLIPYSYVILAGEPLIKYSFHWHIETFDKTNPYLFMQLFIAILHEQYITTKDVCFLFQPNDAQHI